MRIPTKYISCKITDIFRIKNFVLTKTFVMKHGFLTYNHKFHRIGTFLLIFFSYHEIMIMKKDCLHKIMTFDIIWLFFDCELASHRSPGYSPQLLQFLTSTQISLTVKTFVLSAVFVFADLSSSHLCPLLVCCHSVIPRVALLSPVRS